MGLVSITDGASNSDLKVIFADIQAKAQRAPQNLFSLPPVRAFKLVSMFDLYADEMRYE